MTVKQLTTPTTIRIEPELKVWLLQKAYVEKRNVSNLINYLLSQSKQKEDDFIGYQNPEKEDDMQLKIEDVPGLREWIEKENTRND